MLICPQCQFENPDTHNFCQKCGTSLTEKNCPQCGTEVAIDTITCPNCQAFVGNVWLAVIAKQVNPQQITNASPSLDFEFYGDYLDPGSRYLFLNRDEITTGKASLTTKVVDSNHLKTTILEEILEQNTPIFEEFEQKNDHSDISNPEFWQQIGIPAIALPYLTLQELAPAIPELRDTWIAHEQAVILLEDRSDWLLLSDMWGSEDLPAGQILQWLDEMAHLWHELAKVNCCQSLLEESNIRVDGYQTLCLELLYLDPPEQKPELKELARTWQLLYNKSGRTQYGAISELLKQLSNGTIETVSQLRFVLREIMRDSSVNITAILNSKVEENQANIIEEDDYDDDYDSSPATVPFDNLIPEISAVPSTIPVNFQQPGNASEGDDLPTVVLPMQLLSLDDAGCTDIGMQRDHNEDYYGIETKLTKQENILGKQIQARGLYIVCDGMGGHAAGEVASAMAVETLQAYFQEHWQEQLPDEETIRNGILHANETLYQVNLEHSRSGSARMGTTLVMALVQNNRFAIAHVGDSRIYRVNRKWGLEQLTIDHEVGQREIQRGVEPDVAYGRPDAYQLTQALGPRDNSCVKPDIQYFELNEDTLLLLCSDGLSDNNLIEENWQTYLTPLISSKANLEQGCLDLIDFANKHNGHDNITALVVRIKVRPNLDQSSLF